MRNIKRHFESMRVKGLSFEPEVIVLADDVITRCFAVIERANKLSKVFPDARIRKFAAMSNCRVGK